MKTITFLNGDAELKERAIRHLDSTAEDMEFFMKYSHCEDIDELKEELRSAGENFRTIRQRLNQFEELGSFYDYGLGYDYVELGTFNDQTEDYFRYQMSYGGPSDEIRFYQDGTIEYVFLDWFVGVGFNITGEDWAEWLKEWFDGCGSMNFEEKRGKYDYYEELVKLEENED